MPSKRPPSLATLAPKSGTDGKPHFSREQILIKHRTASKVFETCVADYAERAKISSSEVILSSLCHTVAETYIVGTTCT